MSGNEVTNDNSRQSLHNNAIQGNKTAPKTKKHVIVRFVTMARHSAPTSSIAAEKYKTIALRQYVLK